VRWVQVTLTIWRLVLRDGAIIRQVAKLGPYLGDPAEKYIVTGDGYTATEHTTLMDAMTAARVSVHSAEPPH
jgi:hypothetical protein